MTEKLDKIIASTTKSGAELKYVGEGDDEELAAIDLTNVNQAQVRALDEANKASALEVETLKARVKQLEEAQQAADRPAAAAIASAAGHDKEEKNDKDLKKSA